MLNPILIKKNYIVMNLINILHLHHQYHYLNNRQLSKKGNILNSMLIMKNYFVMNLINILHLQHQFHYLNNNQLSKRKLNNFNSNNEELYCNDFAKYLAPSSPILFPE